MPREATGDDVDRVERGPDAGRRVRAARRCDRGARDPRPGSVHWQAAPARRHSACAVALRVPTAHLIPFSRMKFIPAVSCLSGGGPRVYKQGSTARPQTCYSNTHTTPRP